MSQHIQNKLLNCFNVLIHLIGIDIHTFVHSFIVIMTASSTEYC